MALFMSKKVEAVSSTAKILKIKKLIDDLWSEIEKDWELDRFKTHYVKETLREVAKLSLKVANEVK